MIQFGIIGHKYNFKNNKWQQVVISIDQAETKLVYNDAKNQG